MNFLIDIDTNIFLFLNSLHSPFADRIMQLISERFIWIPMYAALLLVVIRNYGWRKAALIIVGVAAAVALADQTCATFIRPAVQRLRPSNPDNPLSALVHIVDGYRGGCYGFPSCHAANTFALLGMLTPLVRERRFTITMAAWALLNCYSRIHLGVHYPGDLIAGAAIGLLCGAACYLVVKLVAFGNRRPETTYNDTADLYTAWPIFGHIPALKLTSLRFRYTDFIILAAASTALSITLISL